MSGFGYTVYSCPHEECGTVPCPKGCNSEENHRLGLASKTYPPPPTTCPACLGTGPEHDHGCPDCGGYECDCEAEELRDLLRDHEWDAYSGDGCSTCEGQRPDHKDGCLVKKALEAK